MRIDAHQHFWLYNSAEYGWIDESMAAIRRDFLPEDLAGELSKNDFDGSVAVQTRQTSEETSWLLELAAASPRVFGVVGWVDLRSPDAHSQLRSFAGNPKLVGVRHIAQAEPDDRFLLQPDFLRGISLLEEFDLAYDILIYTRHLPVATQFVEKFPRQRFVLDHMAKPPIKTGEIDLWEDGIRQLAAFPNICCKVSGLVTEADWQHWTPEQIRPYLDVVFDAFGSKRLMIGSDWPVCLVAGGYGRVMNLVKDYVRSNCPGALEAILGENARRFWHLKA
jgi:L-fuconolactonase